jgi:glycosyltransferase involved in cell wall biosynthesis
MANLELLQETINVPDDRLREGNKLVSVVIPTYNRAELVERAVHSALSQTYSNLEVIIVDDASTDDSGDRIKTLQNIDQRVRYFRHDRNRGAQAARNTGISAAKGGYIAFLDSDDEWLPQKLSLQMALFSQEIVSPGVIYCGLQEVSPDGRMSKQFLPEFRGYIYPQALSNWVAGTDTVVVRREILEKIHGFDEKVRAYQEWDLCIRLAQECEFDFVPDCLTLYHQHTAPSISKDFLRDANGYLSLVDTYRKEILRECGGRALSAHYLQTGRLFVRADQFDQARTYFLKSIRNDPLNFKAMIHFGVSMFGKDIYRLLRSYRQVKFPVP